MSLNKLYIYLFFLIVSFSFAQTDTIFREPAVFGKGRIKDKKILLKWNVNDPVLWKKSLVNGYKVQRTTVTRDGNPIMKDETVILKEKLLPLPLEDWEAISEQDSLVLVVAQAIHGKEFQIVRNDNSLNSMMILNDENNQRFAFSLMTAEQSYLATKAAGWGLEDETAKPNEKYVYTITLLGLEKPIPSATIYIGLEDKTDKTPPLQPEAIFGNKTVMIIWDFKSQETLYSSYHLERSEDGINFKRLNKAPIFSWETKSTIISYTDNLEQNNKKYYYRVLGIDTFGEISNPSKIISGIGLDILEYSPQITAKGAINDELVNIEWEFPEEGEFKISGFQILQANTESGDFKIVKKEIPVKERKQVFKANLEPSNYFKVRAVAKNGLSKESYPMLVQPVDSIPPVAPIDLQGTIDSLGVVKLKWKKNTEKDLYGYKVFRGYSKNDEFSQITTQVWANNVFNDSINAKTLNKKVFYKIIAVDKRYNESSFSKIVEIIKVDKIAPATPLISDFEIGTNQVTLKIEQSPSEDVVKHILYRRSEKETDWKIISEIKDKTITSYTDTKITAKTKYYYTLTAFDDAGNESDFAEPLIADPIPILVKPAIKGMGTFVDRTNKYIEIFWESKEKDIMEYHLYKKKNDGSFMLYKILDSAPKVRYTDNVINPGNKYTYTVKAVFKDGTASKFEEAFAAY